MEVRVARASPHHARPAFEVFFRRAGIEHLGVGPAVPRIDDEGVDIEGRADLFVVLPGPRDRTERPIETHDVSPFDDRGDRFVEGDPIGLVAVGHRRRQPARHQAPAHAVAGEGTERPDGEKTQRKVLGGVARIGRRIRRADDVRAQGAGQAPLADPVQLALQQGEDLLHEAIGHPREIGGQVIAVEGVAHGHRAIARQALETHHIADTAAQHGVVRALHRADQRFRKILGAADHRRAEAVNPRTQPAGLLGEHARDHVVVVALRGILADDEDAVTRTHARAAQQEVPRPGAQRLVILRHPRLQRNQWHPFRRHRSEVSGSAVRCRERRYTCDRSFANLGAAARGPATDHSLGYNETHPSWCPKSGHSNLMVILGPIWPLPKGYYRAAEPIGYGHWYMP